MCFLVSEVPLYPEMVCVLIHEYLLYIVQCNMDFWGTPVEPLEVVCMTATTLAPLHRYLATKKTPNPLGPP